MPRREKTCSECRWFETGERADRGHCHRYPPIHIGPERWRDNYPRVETSSSCGEFKRKH